MTGEACRVPYCQRPVHAASVCDPCLDDLEADLRALGARRAGEGTGLAHALEAAYLRQQRFSVASIGIPNPDESSVPYNEAAGKVRRDLSRTLLRWWLVVQDVTPDSGYVCYGERTPATVEAMVEYLLRYRGWFRANPAGADAVVDFSRITGKAKAVVDRPPDLVYLGICSMRTKTPDGVDECPEDLYAVHGKDVTVCRRCKNQHDVKHRQQILLNSVKDQLATASDISRGLSGLDMVVTAERIRQWKTRGRIVPRGDADRPLYRVGDVIDLIVADAERLSRQPETTKRGRP
jgi:hypothetical protein